MRFASDAWTERFRVDVYEALKVGYGRQLSVWSEIYLQTQLVTYSGGGVIKVLIETALRKR